jgi:peptidoglycan/LPS O-acetylase OafA/YrhL
MSLSGDRKRVLEIDVLKGFCILCVVAIHAQFPAGTAVFDYLIDRAVPVFLVLFGVTSELWWGQNENAPNARRRWYWSRLGRVVPAYWAVMVCWWLVVVYWRGPPDDLVLRVPQIAITFLGAAGWVGTTWFVTIILQYILVFPLLRRVAGHAPPVVVLGIAAIATGATAIHMLAVINVGEVVFGKNVGELYYYWVSLPRALWHVVGGIFIARFWHGTVSLRTTLLAVLISLCGATLLALNKPISSDWIPHMRHLACVHLLDVPLAIALLGLCRWLPLPRFAKAGLAWFGRWSWGIYLAHLLVHEVARIVRFDPTLQTYATRAAYAFALLASGVLIAVAAQRTAKLFTRLYAALRGRPVSAEPCSRPSAASTHSP